MPRLFTVLKDVGTVVTPPRLTHAEKVALALGHDSVMIRRDMGRVMQRVKLQYPDDLAGVSIHYPTSQIFIRHSAGKKMATHTGRLPSSRQRHKKRTKLGSIKAKTR